jgi:hypothetical protein
MIMAKVSFKLFYPSRHNKRKRDGTLTNFTDFRCFFARCNIVVANWSCTRIHFVAGGPNFEESRLQLSRSILYLPERLAQGFRRVTGFFAGTAFRLKNIYRNAVPARSGTTTPLLLPQLRSRPAAPTRPLLRRVQERTKRMDRWV